MPATRSAELIEPLEADEMGSAVRGSHHVFWHPIERGYISVPARVLARIDDYARRHGESRSGFLVRAAQQAMRG